MMDWMIWMLRTLLPSSYRKENDDEIIESTICYIKELQEQLSEKKLNHSSNSNVLLKFEQPNVVSSFSGFDQEKDIETILKDLENFEYDDRKTEFRFECMTVEDILIQKSLWSDGDPIRPLQAVPEDQSKIKRPGNGFIRFSIAKRKEVTKKHPNCDNREISRILGCMWRKLSDEDKKVYVCEFYKEMQERREKHPDWNYAASRAKKAKKEDMTIILVDRLRSRKTKPFAIEAPMTVLKKKKASKKKKPEKNMLDLWVQCDSCGQWRKLLKKSEELPDIWNCSMNPDPFYNDCFMEQQSD